VGLVALWAALGSAGLGCRSATPGATVPVPAAAAARDRGAVTASLTYPDSAWETVTDLAAAGFDPARFDTLRARAEAEGTSTMVVVVGGRVVFAFGDVARPTYLASARKSVLSMLYGRYVADGTVRLDATLAALGVDDLGGLLPAERAATVGDLLAARSGVYHPAANGGDASALAPPRGSVRPGAYFLYNNWDFNALGAILERATGEDLYGLFERDLARPLGFQDWMREVQPKRNDTGASRYPAHHLVLSTRDMARLGYCMLRGGRWREVQVVPAAWVARTTRVVTPAAEVARTSPFHPRLGYGFLWWVLDPAAQAAAPAGSPSGAVRHAARRPVGGPADPWAGAYTATGAYGQYLTVLPALDVVIAHKVFAPPPPARQVREDAYLDRLLPLVVAAVTPRGH
jgi:CubicO group peptidase (beta-lactamase class C family)